VLKVLKVLKVLRGSKEHREHLKELKVHRVIQDLLGFQEPKVQSQEPKGRKVHKVQ
jgi:hypothetical protein